MQILTQNKQTCKHIICSSFTIVFGCQSKWQAKQKSVLIVLLFHSEKKVNLFAMFSYQETCLVVSVCCICAGFCANVFLKKRSFFMTLFLGNQEVCPTMGDFLDNAIEPPITAPYQSPLPLSGLLHQNYPNFPNKMISVLLANHDQTTLSGATRYLLSDGTTYETQSYASTITHTWDKTKDILTSNHGAIRWVISATHSPTLPVYTCSFQRQVLEVLGRGNIRTMGESLSVASINPRGLNDCYNLRQVNFFDMTSNTIESYAFLRANKLQTVVLPQTLTTISPNAFENCTSLNSINLEQTSLKTIANSAFGGCLSLSQINFPTTLTTLGNASFANTGLQSLVLPPSTTSVGSSAFANTAIKTLQCLATNCTFGASAFTKCTSLKTASFSEGISSLSTSMFEYCYHLKKVFLPSSLLHIPQSCFKDCHTLNQILGSPYPTQIGSYAFYGCNMLTNAPNCNNLTSLGAYAFQNCKNIFEVDPAPQLTTLDDRALFGFVGIQSLDMPNVTQIGERALGGCSNLTTLALSNNLESIATNAFEGTHQLRTLHIPATCTNLSATAFTACYGLENLTFPPNFDIELNFSTTRNLSRVSLENMIANLSNRADTTPKTMVLGLFNLPKVSQDYHNLATQKNWILT